MGAKGSYLRAVESESPNQRAVLDNEHLRLLTIFHYVFAGMSALFACFPIIHLMVGLGIVVFGQRGGSNAPPAFMGWIFVAFALVFISVGWTVAILVFFGGRNLAVRKRYTFCLVVACVECVFMPLGTILGVFTIIVLSRPTVKALFPDAGT